MAESSKSPATDGPTYEDLSLIEHTTEAIDVATLAFQTHLLAPTHTRRAQIASQIDHFWPLVFEQAPQDVDQYIQPSDSAVFAACLTGFEVKRFESKGSAEDFQKVLKDVGKQDISLHDGAFGEPRSLSFRFEFAENEWFEDRVLEKKFWLRRARAQGPLHWSGRVSEPLRIRWKAGKDLSEGLTDAARDLWEAQEKAGLLKTVGGKEGKKDDEKSKSLPEYKKLVDLVEASTEGSQSFFTWFGFRGRWVGKEEHELAVKEERERWQKVGTRATEGGSKEGQPTDEEREAEEAHDDNDEEDLMPSESAAEVFMDGEELALALAEDVWPNAAQYYIDASMEDSDAGTLSSGSFDAADLEEIDVDDLDGADQNMEEIRTMTKKKGKQRVEEGPPAKKRKA